MSSIFLVTAGEYSSYGWVCAFTKKEDADAYVGRRNKVHPMYEEAMVEEIQLDTNIDVARSEEFFWDILFGVDGSVQFAFSHLVPSSRVIENFRESTGRIGVFIPGVVAKDEEGAVKIAAELRARWIAEKEGIA